MAGSIGKAYNESSWWSTHPMLPTSVLRYIRTNLFSKAPLTRTLITLNKVAENIDIFACSLNEFTKTFVVAGVLLTMIEVGIFLGYTACLQPVLQDPHSDIKADLDTSSWIAATLGLTSIPGFFSSSFYMDRYGRRIAFILNIIPGAIGLLLMYFATDIYCLIAARAFQGVTTGSTMILGAIIIGEYVDPVYRGMFLNLKTALVYSGSAIVHILGNYFHWRSVALISLVLYFIIFGMVWMWPESPSWLAAKDNFERSEKNFYWLRGKTEQSRKELKEMFKSIQDRTKSKRIGCLNRFRTFFQKFSRKDFVIPVQIYLFAAILLETCGTHIFPSYGSQIISEVLESSSQGSKYYTLCLDILITLSAFLSSFLIKMFKRRTLLFFTGAAAFAVIMTGCGYLYLVSSLVISNESWIPIILFALYLGLVNSACAPICFSLMGEIFPLEHKSAGTTIAGLLISASSFIALKTFPLLLSKLKVHGSFFILGITMAVSLVFLYFMLPETKDRTLQEITDYFNDGIFNVYDLVQEVEDVESKMIT